MAAINTPINTAYNVAKENVRDQLRDQDAYSTEAQLSALRNMWMETTDEMDRQVIEAVAFGIEQGPEVTSYNTRSEEFMDLKSSDAWTEDYNGVALADEGKYLHFDEQDSPSRNRTDSDWLTIKVNNFIKRLSFKSRSGNLYLKSNSGASNLNIGGSDGWIEFTCYGKVPVSPEESMGWGFKQCEFSGRHFVGDNKGMAEVVIGFALAHTYKH